MRIARIFCLLILSVVMTQVKANIYTVTTNTGTGAGTLYAAIDSANANLGYDTIQFDIQAGAGLSSILLSSGLNFITEGVLIDGYSESVSELTNKPVQLGGGGSVNNGFVFLPGAEGSIVQGMAFVFFADYGVLINDADSVTVRDCNFGVNQYGNTAGQVGGGVSIIDARYCLVGGEDAGNVITECSVNGVRVEGIGSIETEISYNNIGDSYNGVAQHGIELTGGVTQSLIFNNVVSGAGEHGIYIHGTGTNENVIRGNMIGLNALGDSPVPNTKNGIYIFSGPSDNVIGGGNVVDRNLIGSNGLNGIAVENSSNQEIRGNFIGIASNGTSPLGNDENGVYIKTSDYITIEGNTISANGKHGVLFDENASFGTVKSNIIGGSHPDALGNLGNNDDGIHVHGGAGGNGAILIGDGTDAGKNLIVYNSDGVEVRSNAKNVDVNHNLVYLNDVSPLNMDETNTIDPPVIDSVIVNGGLTTFYFESVGVNSGYVRFDFYGSILGQAQYFMGTDSVEVTNGMKLSYTFPTPVGGVVYSVLATQWYNSSDLSNGVIGQIRFGPSAPTAVDDAITMQEDETNFIFSVVNNDTDVDGDLDSTTVRAINPLPSNGSAALITGSGSFKYTPTADFNGLDTIYYQVCDMSAVPLCSEAKVVITVQSVDDKPVAVDATLNLVQGRDSIIDFVNLVSDVDDDIDSSSVRVVYQSNPIGVYSANVQGMLSLRYGDIPLYKGEDTIIVEVCDQSSPTPLCDSAELILSVAQGQRPAVSNTTLNLLEDSGMREVDLLTLITDADSPITIDSIKIIGNASGGSAIINSSGGLEYTPNDDFFGSDSVAFEFCDFTNLCEDGKVRFEVDNVPDDPVAVNDSATVNQASAVVVNIAGNDIDVDGDLDVTSVVVLDIVSGTDVSENTILDGEIQVNYDFNPTFVGFDTIKYLVCDFTLPIPACDTGYVFLVIESGDGPNTQSDTLTLLEDEVGGGVRIYDNDIAPLGNLDRSKMGVIKEFSHATVNYVAVTERLNISLEPNFFGLDTLIYEACDFLGGCTQDTVFLTVVETQDPLVLPSFDSTLYQTGCIEGVLAFSIFDGVQVLDSDQWIDTSSFSASSFRISRASVTVSLSDGLLVVSSFINNSFVGQDTLYYTLCDNRGICDSSVIILDVVENPAPVILDDTARFVKGGSSTLDVLSNDTDNVVGIDRQTLTIIKNLSNGTNVVTSAKQIFIDYSSSEYEGLDTLIYEVCDSNCLCSQGNLIVDIEMEPVEPAVLKLYDDVFAFQEGCVEASINVFDNDSLTSNIRYSTTRLLAPYDNDFHWSLSEAGLLNANYLDEIASQSFTVSYTLCDSLNNCDTADVTVNVLRNDGPIINIDPIQFVEGDPLSQEIDVQGNAFDSDGVDLSTLVITQGAALGNSFVDRANGVIQLTYDVVEDYDARDTILFEVCDSTCICSSDTVAISFRRLGELLIYEGFSPNDDGVNDYWEMDNLDLYPVNSVEVFNRWGNLVYRAENYSLETLWDGVATEGITIDGGALPSGVYYYVFFIDGVEEPIKGQILIQR